MDVYVTYHRNAGSGPQIYDGMFVVAADTADEARGYVREVLGAAYNECLVERVEPKRAGVVFEFWRDIPRTVMLHHPATHRLGKKDPKLPRFMVRDFIDVEKVLFGLAADAKGTAQVVVDQTHGQSVPLSMYGNSNTGDCTFAGIGNILRVNSDGSVDVSNQDVQTGYIAVTTKEGHPYDPATGANADAGCYELDVLDYWATVGVGGHKILGHGGVDITNLDEVTAVLKTFGSVYPGWQLRTVQQTQPVWDFVATSAAWGGHCAPIGARVPIPALGGKLGWVLLTWGAYKYATDRFVQNQGDEGHAVITDAWVAANQDNPAVNLSGLLAAIKQLKPES